VDVVVTLAGAGTPETGRLEEALLVLTGSTASANL
jgi:hypothetical protein